MNDFQNDFMKALGKIQKETVEIALVEKTEFKSKEDELYSITSEMIYRILELMDGYGNYSIGKMDIRNTLSGESLKDDPYIELHDAVADFIRE